MQVFSGTHKILFPTPGLTPPPPYLSISCWLSDFSVSDCLAVGAPSSDAWLPSSLLVYLLHLVVDCSTRGFQPPVTNLHAQLCCLKVATRLASLPGWPDVMWFANGLLSRGQKPPAGARQLSGWLPHPSCIGWVPCVACI